MLCPKSEITRDDSAPREYRRYYKKGWSVNMCICFSMYGNMTIWACAVASTGWHSCVTFLLLTLVLRISIYKIKSQ